MDMAEWVEIIEIPKLNLYLEITHNAEEL